MTKRFFPPLKASLKLTKYNYRLLVFPSCFCLKNGTSIFEKRSSDAVRQKLSAKLLPAKKKVPEAKLVYKQRILPLSAAIPGGLGVERRAHN